MTNIHQLTHSFPQKVQPMNAQSFVSADEIRSRFSRLMSDMYREEVPQYGTLVELVSDVNRAALVQDHRLRDALSRTQELDRLGVERHGAIRLGTAQELSTMRRIFAVMGMFPVGYYDLSVAGVPVHSTCFRPVTDEALAKNPFRVFTSLLRLELIAQPDARDLAAGILARRSIFTPRALALVEQFERQRGLSSAEADEFVAQVRETFRWHREATVDQATYERLHDAHRLIADVVCFKGPHINHLTPRTLDIDRVQAQMPTRGITPKDVVEGPPPRAVPILLRQTSFKALAESVAFAGQEDGLASGTHTARFGEIEQRGAALTPKGRALYDALLQRVRDIGSAGNAGPDYTTRLAAAFQAFPDDLVALRQQGLAYFRYTLTPAGVQAVAQGLAERDVDALIADGLVAADPLTYEDFLPVSAAGIFQSNLGGTEQKSYSANAAQAAFEASLGAPVQDECALYEQAQARSLAAVRAQLSLTAVTP